jgi:hypothetical protein
MRAAMRVLTHASGKVKFLPDRRNIYVAVKVDPLAAVFRPCLSAKGFFETGCDHDVFKVPEVFACHKDLPVRILFEGIFTVEELVTVTVTLVDFLHLQRL